MRASFNGTLVTGLISGDAGGLPEIPAHMRDFPMIRLRVVDGVVIDAAGLTRFWIDPNGRKQAAQLDPTWPSVDCIWSDRIVAIDGGWRAVTAAERLAEVKAQLCAEIDGEAERERMKYVTPGAGQQAVYIAKEDDARKVIATEDPQPADYPILAASIGVDGATLVEVANAILATAASWRVIAGAIEGVRLHGKQAVNAAETETAARAARAAIVWPGA